MLFKWRELFSVLIAIPEMRSYACDSLRIHAEKAWQTYNQESKEDLLEQIFASMFDDPLEDQAGQQQFLLYLALWRLMLMTADDRQRFWTDYRFLYVHHDKPFEFRRQKGV